MSYNLPKEANEHYRPQIMQILDELNKEKSLESRVEFMYQEDYNPHIYYAVPDNSKTKDITFMRIWLKRENDTVTISGISFRIENKGPHGEHIWGGISSVDFTLNIDPFKLDKQLVAEVWRN